jgi:hypothetical protein
MKYREIIVMCLGLAGVLTGCGGGGGGGGDAALSSGTVTATGVSSGAITGFGSVFVNGVKFNTDSAEVFRGDDQLNDVRELSIGMLVRVEGDLDRRIANRVRFEEDVKGPADGAASGDRFSVMGQTVITDAGTVFNNTSLAAIAAGDVLEISGLRNADDDIVARYVEGKAGPASVNRYSLVGNVRNLDTNARTFLIDGLTVDYGVAQVNDLPGGNPTEGQLVEVKDDNKAYLAGSLALAATAVEPRNRLGNGVSTGAKVEVERLVTRVNSSNEFELGELLVRTGPSTSFLFGSPDGIAVGARLEVEGIIDGNGVLQATKVKFEDNGLRIQAHVDPLGVDAGSGTVTLLGVTVAVDGATSMEDKRDGVSPFGIGAIGDSDYLEIRGFRAANGVFIATELIRDQDDARAEMRSPVTNVDAVAGTVEILGITINTDGSTRFRDEDDQPITASQFFGALVGGLTPVQAKWDPFTDVSAPVRELELEDD